MTGDKNNVKKTSFNVPNELLDKAKKLVGPHKRYASITHFINIKLQALVKGND